MCIILRSNPLFSRTLNVAAKWKFSLRKFLKPIFITCGLILKKFKTEFSRYLKFFLKYSQKI